MTTPPAVLFIDDDHRLVEQYARAAEIRGLRAHRTFGVDEALQRMRAGLSVDAIVWDMMLVPGEAFAEEETESGLSTGKFLYPQLRRLSPNALFVLLTNDATSVDAYERPAERSFGRAKRYTSARLLAAFLAKQLGVPRPRASTKKPASGPRVVASKSKSKARGTKPASAKLTSRAPKSVTRKRAQRVGKG